MTNNSHNILGVDLAQELKDNYILYSYSIFNRALPSCVDGLKVAQRRILLGLNDLNLVPHGPYKKVSRLEGHVLGSYHPQGSCGGTAINMGQADTLRYPLTNIHGNVGGSIQSGPACGKTISDDPPAAARYLEVKSTPIAHKLYLEGLDKYSHEWTDNYDGSTKEVVNFVPVLPALLINGSSGIAAGYACNHISYNLNEIIQSVRHWIKHKNRKNLTIEELFSKDILHGPDLPNGGRISKTNLVDIAKTGSGSAHVYGTWEFKDIPWGKRSTRKAIVITSVASGSGEKFLNRTKTAIEEERIADIADITDLSNKEGIEILVVLKPNADPNIVLPQLLQYTNLYDTFNVNATALLGHNLPKQMGILEIIGHWFEARKTCLKKQFIHEKEVSENRLEIVLGLIILSDNIDRAVKIIRESKDPAEAETKLMGIFALSTVQAKAILALSLNKLVGTEKARLGLEKMHYEGRIKELDELISSDEQMERYIHSEVSLLRKEDHFKDPRRSEIIDHINVKSSIIGTHKKVAVVKTSPKDEIKAQAKSMGIPTKVVNQFFKDMAAEGKSIKKYWGEFAQNYYEFNTPRGKKYRRERLGELKERAQKAGMPKRGKDAWAAFMTDKDKIPLGDIEKCLLQTYASM